MTADTPVSLSHRVLACRTRAQIAAHATLLAPQGQLADLRTPALAIPDYKAPTARESFHACLLVGGYVVCLPQIGRF